MSKESYRVQTPNSSHRSAKRPLSVKHPISIASKIEQYTQKIMATTEGSSDLSSKQIGNLYMRRGSLYLKIGSYCSENNLYKISLQQIRLALSDLKNADLHYQSSKKQTKAKCANLTKEASDCASTVRKILTEKQWTPSSLSKNSAMPDLLFFSEAHTGKYNHLNKDNIKPVFTAFPS